MTRDLAAALDLARALDTLRPRDREIVSRWLAGQTLAEIGRALPNLTYKNRPTLGVSRERIRQQLAKSLAHLQRRLTYDERRARFLGR